MGNIVGKPFGVVASKDYNTALTESVKEGNQAKFYLTENGGKGFNDITATTDDSRNTLIVNGNKIQGVSTSDINKLNLISGSGLITDGAFKYKGSVKNFESLPTNANIGDVYNILDIFKTNGTTYPVNSCVFYFDDGNTKWHPLTDTPQIGTEGYVENRYSNLDRLTYISKDYHRPIDSFDIRLNNDSGLYASNGKIYIKLGLGLSTSSDGIVPSLGPGLDLNSDNKITHKLGSSKVDNNEGDRTRCSGLYIDSSYGLNVALATDIYNTNSYIGGIVRLDEQDASIGGLAIDSKVLSNWLENDKSVENYIISITRNNLRLGSGLTNSQKKDIQLNLGHCLFINDSDQIDISVGSGLTISSNNKLTVPVGKELEINNSNLIKLNANYLSGTVKDLNNFYYSLGGIYFSDTIKSGQKNDNITVGPSQIGIRKKNYGLRLRCGTGLAFQEGYEDIGDNSSQILGHDGRYYVNIDNTTIGLNTDSKLRVKHDSTLSESSKGLSVKVGNSLAKTSNGIDVNLPRPTLPDLQQLPVSTAAILINDIDNGLCVDMPAFKRLVELVIATNNLL